MNRSPWRRAIQYAAPTLLLILTALVLVLPSVISGDPNAINTGRILMPPGQGRILGYDQLGRDEGLRLLHGGRMALATGLAAVTSSTVIATLLGLTAGYLGGKIDLAIAAVIDLLLSVPGLLVTLAVLGILGTGRLPMMVALVGGSWASEARIIRSKALSTRTSGYVEAARALGATDRRILWKHVLPNSMSTLLVLASLSLGEILLVVSGLSFLGLGAQPPDADWGTMLAGSRPYLGQAPWLMVAPGACIVLFSLLCNLSGDALRSALDRRAGS